MNLNSVKLIDGDIKQYTEQLGSLNIANGSFGAIMALHRSNGLDINIEDWVNKNLENYLKTSKNDFEKIPVGLFDGLSGIATVLYEIGFESESLKLLKSIKLPENYIGENLTLYSGWAGVGLNYIAFFSITKDIEFFEKALNIYKLIKKYFIENEKLYINDAESLPYGLLYGWSGISLFVLYISRFLQDSEKETAYRLSLKMLDYEIENNININNVLELAQIQEYSLGHKRLIPYLGEGAAGLALVLFEFSKQNPYFDSNKYDDLLYKLSNITDLYSTYTSGLFRGTSGMIVLSNAKSKIYKNKKSLNYTIELLSNYMVFNEKVGLVMPGDYGYRLSMDIQTGLSGVLLALNDINTGKWNSWLPIPIKNELNIFEI